LVLGRGGDIPFNCQVAEECLYLWFTYCLWVPLIVEKDEALDPVDIGLLSRVGIIFKPYYLANSI
jgi:hypothetical protein